MISRVELGAFLVITCSWESPSFPSQREIKSPNGCPLEYFGVLSLYLGLSGSRRCLLDQQGGTCSIFMQEISSDGGPARQGPEGCLVLIQTHPFTSTAGAFHPAGCGEEK